MKWVLRGVHYRVGVRMRDLVVRQLVQRLERHLADPNAEVEIQLRDGNGPKGGLDKEALVNVFIPNGPALRLTETSDDMYKTIHLLSDRLERAVRKALERRREPVTFYSEPKIV